MYEIIETDACYIQVKNSEEVRQEIFDRLILLLKQLDSFSGESLFQCDETHIESPSFICQLVDEVLKPKVVYKDNIKINIGDYIIINDSDKPCTRLIAKATEVDYFKNFIKAKYICKNTNMVECYGRLDLAIRVTDFGVKLQFGGGYVTATEATGR